MPTALIAGASRGIGKAIALQLADKGYNLVLLARNYADLTNLANFIHNQTSAKCLIISTDVSQEQAVAQAIDQTVATFGTIDVLINNAGIGVFKLLEDISTAEFEQVMDTNLKATFLLCKFVVPHLKRQLSGHILSIASDVAKRTFAYGSVYCASKYAQDALLMALRQELREYQIRVTTIYPGLTDTYFHNSVQGAEHKKDYLKAEDVAQAVIYALQTPTYVNVDEIMLHPMSQKW